MTTKESGTTEKFQMEKLEEYNYKELKQFCIELGIATTGLSTKEDFKKALESWAETGTAVPRNQSLEAPETNTPPMEERRSGLSPEEIREREKSRLHELELARLRLDGELKLAEQKITLEHLRLQEEREERQRQRELEEKKLAYEHERNLKEIELRKQNKDLGVPERPNTPTTTDPKVHIPKDVVREYYRNDDIQQWFKAYEVAMTSHRIPRGDWGAGLWGRFVNEGRDALLQLPDHQMTSYDHMKAALLTRYGLTPEMYRQRFRDCKRIPGTTWVEYVNFFSRAFEGWIKGSKVTTYEQLFDLIVWEHLSNNCFIELRQHLLDSKLTEPRQLAAEADRWESTRVARNGPSEPTRNNQGPHRPRGGGGGQGRGRDAVPVAPASNAPPPAGRGNTPMRPGFRANITCHRCQRPGHYASDPNCPKNQNPTPRQVAAAALEAEQTLEDPEEYETDQPEWEPAAMSLVCLGERDMIPRAPLPANTRKYSQWVNINGRQAEALRDTGASVTAVRCHLVTPEQILPNVLCPVRSADNSESLCRMACVPFEWGGVSGMLKVTVRDDAPVDCLLGNDLESSPWAAVERREHLGMLGLPEWACVTTRSMAARAIASPEEPEWPAPPPPTVPEGAALSANPPEQNEEKPVQLQDLPELAQWRQEGGPTQEQFRQEQKTCPSLEGLRQQALAQSTGDTSGAHWIYWDNDLLYSEQRIAELGASRVLVVPLRFRDFLLNLAHDVPLAGHLGQDKTYNRLVTHFYWPKMRNDVSNHCRACPTCQASGKSGRKIKAPLQPFPVVTTPFERVGIDIVGPLDPRTAQGHRFILVLVDHATRYPEAIPLRTVTAPVVGRALMGIFSRVGFPREVVSDRGTNFISKYMKSLWQQCGVTYRFTTPYHPQGNGLVERFNRTLKGMILGLEEPLRRQWDVLLPCLLFAYREVPQKSLGFSPFELLYGHPVRGPLSLVKEGWEMAPQKTPPDVYKYLLALRNQTRRFRELAKANLEASQEDMKKWYDRHASSIEFEPGQQVWVMSPVEPCALQDKWTGPFKVVERKGPVTYLIDMESSRNPLRVLHANRLKPHFIRTELSLLMATDNGAEEDSEPLPDLLREREKDGSVEGVRFSDTLSPEQRQDCRALLLQFANLFSLTPGVTPWCLHDVDTGDRQQVSHDQSGERLHGDN